MGCFVIISHERFDDTKYVLKNTGETEYLLLDEEEPTKIKADENFKDSLSAIKFLNKYKEINSKLIKKYDIVYGIIYVKGDMLRYGKDY